MQITVTDADGQVFALELTEEAEVTILKELISVELGIPPDNQHILLDGQPLWSGARTLAEAGVGEGAMLLVFSSNVAAATQPESAAFISPQQQLQQRQQHQQLQQRQQHQQLQQRQQQQRRTQPRANLPLDFSSIVIDGGRVAQFPAGGAPGAPADLRAAGGAAAAAPAASSAAATSAAAPAAAAPAPGPSSAQIQLLLRQQAEAILAACAADMAALGILRAQNPRLGDAVSEALQERQGGPQALAPHEATQGDRAQGAAMNRLVDILFEDYETRRKAEEEKRRRLLAIGRDPLSLDAQQFLLEQLQEERINENYSMAREHLPEGFGSVCMLYVHLEINGVPCKAFVDSGAQQSILSLAFAERCSLSSLIDKRFAGLALGVGKAPIIGRVHLAPLKIGTKFCPCSFIVLEDNKMQMMLGLDMLRRYQMIIDLKKNALIVEGEEIPFLSEAQIDKGLFGTGEAGEEEEGEKTVGATDAPKEP